MGKTKHLTVRYLVDENELAALQELADWEGRTVEREFELIMTGGSKWDIQEKIKFCQKMRENEKKKGVPA